MENETIMKTEIKWDKPVGTIYEFSWEDVFQTFQEDCEDMEYEGDITNLFNMFYEEHSEFLNENMWRNVETDFVYMGWDYDRHGCYYRFSFTGFIKKHLAEQN
jgi:hypothetical protein